MGTLCARQRLNFVIDGTMRNTEQTIRNMYRMRKLADQWKHLGARGTRSMKQLRVAVLFIDADVEGCVECFAHVKNNRDGLKFVRGSAQLLKAFVSTNPAVVEYGDRDRDHPNGEQSAPSQHLRHWWDPQALMGGRTSPEK